MIASPVFFKIGPDYVSGNSLSRGTGNLGSQQEPWGNLYVTGTGFLDDTVLQRLYSQNGEITGLSILNLYPVSQPDLGHNNQRWRNLYLTGTGIADTYSSRQLIAATGQITELSLSNLYPVGQPDLGHNTQRWNNLYLTGEAIADEFSSRELNASVGQITGLSVSELYPVGQPDLGHANQRWNDLYATGVGYLDRIETESQNTNSGVFNYLGPTGRFFPPILTEAQRTGLYSGYLTTGVSPFDGLMVYQKPDQNLYVVKSGMWISLT